MVASNMGINSHGNQSVGHIACQPGRGGAAGQQGPAITISARRIHNFVFFLVVFSVLLMAMIAGWVKRRSAVIA